MTHVYNIFASEIIQPPRQMCLRAVILEENLSFSILLQGKSVSSGISGLHSVTCKSNDGKMRKVLVPEHAYLEKVMGP